MARAYPRFLYSSPQNTKSKGPFVVHLLSPRMICKVTNGCLVFLEAFDEASPEEVSAVLDEMVGWMMNQSHIEGKYRPISRHITPNQEPR